MLKEKDSPIKLAKVDGTGEEELIKKNGVTGYPTLFFYRNGEHIKYSGKKLLSIEIFPFLFVSRATNCKKHITIANVRLEPVR